MKILTVCAGGLVRSVALADVLKIHFEPTDVIPVGINFNGKGTKYMLYEWAEKIVVMTEPFVEQIPTEYREKVLVCEVGADTYGQSKHPELLEKVWKWARENQDALGIKEHDRII